MKVTREQRNGWLTCAADRVELGDCPGYESQPIELVEETITRLYGDEHQDWSDPYARAESNSFTYLHSLDGERPTCEHCGSAATLSLAPRPVYRRYADKGPDELVRARSLERAQARRDQLQLQMLERQVEADERSAAGLEQLAQQGDRQGELEQLRELVERQQQQINSLLPAEQISPRGDKSLGEQFDTAVSKSPVKPRRRAEA
jgi:hypothetical protein